MSVTNRPRAWLIAALCLAVATPGHTAEVLAEHIEDYSSSPSTDLPGCADTTSRLVNEFDNAGGWSRRWFADVNATKSDWMSATLAGGDDDAFSDDDDFAYFCGHGNIGLVEFTTNQPDTIFTNTEGRWGDEDAEWVVFDSSKTLFHGGGNLDSWYLNGFEGLHLLIGWHDSPLDTDIGGEFADRLIQRAVPDGGGDDIPTAWFANSGGCTGQNSGTTQKVLAELEVHFDDHVHGEGPVASDAANNAFYWISTNDC